MDANPLLLRMAAAREGHFLLDSGHHGDLWLELPGLFAQPSLLMPAVQTLIAHLQDIPFDAVCGPMTGGALVAQLVALAQDCEFFWTERRSSTDHGVSYALPANLKHRVRGRRVVVLDDAINSGSAVKSTVEALEAEGATPVALCALIALGESPNTLARQARLPIFAVTSAPSHIWDPERCPLCQAGVPLELPGD